MTEDKVLEKLFSEAITDFDDNEQFIATLSSNLDKVAYLKRLQKSRRRSYLAILGVTFAAGAISAAAIILFFPLLPFDAELIRWMLQSIPAGINIGQGKVIASLLAAVIFLSAGLSISSTCR